MGGDSFSKWSGNLWNSRSVSQTGGAAAGAGAGPGRPPPTVRSPPLLSPWASVQVCRRQGTASGGPRPRQRRAQARALLPDYSQLLQKLQFALDLRGSVSVVAESVDKDLKDKGGDSQASPAVSPEAPLRPPRAPCPPRTPCPSCPPSPSYLDVLSVLQLGLVLPLLVLQSVFFRFDKVFVVSTVTVQPLGVQVDDVRYHRIQEVSVVGDH